MLLIINTYILCNYLNLCFYITALVFCLNMNFSCTWLLSMITEIISIAIESYRCNWLSGLGRFICDTCLNKRLSSIPGYLDGVEEGESSQLRGNLINYIEAYRGKSSKSCTLIKLFIFQLVMIGWVQGELSN